MMNVLLINPPAENDVRIVREGRCMQREDAWGTSWAPVTLATIAAVLKNAGFPVRIRDCTRDGTSLERLKDIVRELKPGMVIVNTATPSIDGDLSSCAHVKEVSGDIRTAAIGIHVTALDERCLNEHSGLDFVIRGEPENTARELAEAVRDGTPVGQVAGLSRRENGVVVRNADREFIEDLDTLPFPAWEETDTSLYTMPITGEPFLLVTASRGCPHSCTFCAASALYGKVRRFRSPKRIVDEMEHDLKKFGVSSFLFWSEGFVSRKEHVHGVCEEILKRGLPFKWVANSRVDTVDLPLLEKMRKAGCWMIGYGIESGSQDVLDRVRKGVTLDQIRSAVELTRKAGLKSTAHVIVGIPGETREDILRTSDFIRDLDVDFVQIYCCVPFPGSQVYEEAAKNKWISTEDWRMFEQNFSVLTTPQIAAGEIMRLRRKAFRRFYLSPRRILRVLGEIRSFGDLKNLLVMARNFLKWT